MKRIMVTCLWMLAFGPTSAMSSGCLEAAHADSDTTARRDNDTDRLQNLEDRAAIRSVVDCYGHGHDTIFFHLGEDQREALQILRNCFADDVTTKIVFFDAAQPAVTLTSLSQLVGFIEHFAIVNNYRSARNVPGDVQISRTGPGRARVLSATAAPHFIRKADADAASPASIDLITARYIHDVVRGRDGVWRTQSFTLVIDELWHGTGLYPLPR